MDLFELVGGAAVIVALPLSLLVLTRLLAPDGAGVSDLFAPPTEPGWPRGVQEEETARWRVELLHSADPDRSRSAPSRRPSPDAAPRRAGGRHAGVPGRTH
jgi:hypothetical protein